VIHQAALDFRTAGRGTTDITAEVQRAVADGKRMPGTWQGLYLYEHRTAPHARSVVVTVMGESA
jgi:thiamine phosphate synthase YjbQ (UPF0047 family)